MSMAVCSHCRSRPRVLGCALPCRRDTCQDRRDDVNNIIAKELKLCVSCEDDMQSEMLPCTRVNCGHWGGSCLNAKACWLHNSICCPRGLLQHEDHKCNSCEDTVALFEQAVEALRVGPVDARLLPAVLAQSSHQQDLISRALAIVEAQLGPLRQQKAVAEVRQAQQLVNGPHWLATRLDVLQLEIKILSWEMELPHLLGYERKLRQDYHWASHLRAHLLMRGV